MTVSELLKVICIAAIKAYRYLPRRPNPAILALVNGWGHWRQWAGTAPIAHQADDLLGISQVRAGTQVHHNLLLSAHRDLGVLSVYPLKSSG